MSHPSLPQSPAATRSLAEIAAALDGTLHGDGDFRVAALVHPAELRRADQLVFVMDAGLLPRLVGSPVRAAIVGEGIPVPDGVFAAWVEVPRPRYTLGALMDLFAAPVHAPTGVHPSAVVDPTAQIGADVSIGAMAYVGPRVVIGDGTILLPQCTVSADARLGRDCLIHPGVRIGERVMLGDRVLVHANAVIGGDGFSFVTPQPASFEVARNAGDFITVRNTGLRRINSIGTVMIGDDCEIGSGACIDRSNLGATVIGPGSKLDNMVQIGHNNRIGAGVLVSGQAGIAGSCTIGDGVVIAGQAGIADHTKIGAGSVVGAGSGVWADIKEGGVVFGYPARPKSQTIRREKHLMRLERLFKDIAALKEAIGIKKS
jgi:UDP-3-O-[3-hydroxymyristoyl] glucosamine N-acyltransferase